MKPKRKSFVRTVTALVDADPTYVSIVSAGANGSPFNVVKQENPTMGVKIKPRKAATAKSAPAKKNPVLKNANNRIGKQREALAEASADDRVIVKFFYSKEDFDDEAAVREHLAKSDFEGDVTVTEEDERFVVLNSAIGVARIAKQAEVEADPGVIAVVAILKDESEDDSGEDEEGDEDEDDDTGEDGDDADEEEEDDSSDDDADEEEEAEEEPAPVAKTAPAAPAKSKKALFLADVAAEEEAAELETEEQKLQKFDFWAVYDASSSDFMTLLKEGCEDGLAPGFDDVMLTFGQSIRKTLSGDDEAVDAPLKKNADDFVSVVLGMHNLFASIVNADMAVVEKADQPKAAGLNKWAKSFGKSLVERADRAPAKKGDVTNIIKMESATVDPALWAKALEDAMAPLKEEIATVAKTVDKIGARRQISKGIDPADATTSEGAQKPSATKKKDADPAAVAAAQRIGKSVFAAR